MMTREQSIWIGRWYWSGALLTLFILIIGGVTRLTGSGLSMVDWRPLLGAIPPIGEDAWKEVFDQYRQYPEYQQRNLGMSLSEFQFIFFWEYLHRMSGRLIGLVFLVPFAWFSWSGWFTRREFKRALVLLGLGLGQGLMGWYMVQSGLIDVPWVSHYRLAAHLMLAFLIFGCCVWFALDLQGGRPVTDRSAPVRRLRRWLWLFLSILLLQILWGAFVAGLNAGAVYNTFPLMNNQWVPSAMNQLEPWYRNLLENQAGVQWIHRWLGILLAAGATSLCLKVSFTPEIMAWRGWAVLVLAALMLQVALGIATLLFHVPLLLAVLHQVVAMVLFGLLLAWIHRTGWEIEEASLSGVSSSPNWQKS
jgi:heme a synthase